MKSLMEREKSGELSDRQLRKQSTDDLLRLAAELESNATIQYDHAAARANRIYLIAHEVAEKRGDHMGVDGI